MNRLWAPWRIEFLEAEKTGGCIFCLATGGAKKNDSKGNKEKDDGLLLYESPLSLILLNKYPYNNGHLLISPKRHTAGIETLTDEESADTHSLIKHSTLALKEAFNPDGFNIGMNLGRAAGAGIADHLHWHVVPRWGGDVNFMPVLGDIKVMPEHLRSTLEKLRPYFENL